MPDEKDAPVTTQPAISTEEAAKTDVELSPVGDEKVEVTTEPQVVDNDDPQIKVRDAAKRELDIRIIPWDTPAISRAESFARGAFEVPDPSKVLLMGLEHEVHFGLNGPTRHPVGRGMSYDDQPDGAYMTFKVANTQRGDEVLALAAEGIVNRASIEFSEVPGGKVIETRNGRRHTLYRRAHLSGVATTYRPDYGEQAAVLAVRSRIEGDGQVTETQEVPVNGATPFDLSTLIDKMDARERAQDKLQEKFMERFDQIETRHRQDIEIPNGQVALNEKPKISQGEWLRYVVRQMTGDRITDVEARALDDIVTTDNLGVVPPAFLGELIGVIDARRPFLGSTRRLPTPASGMKMTVPVINQRPTAAVQATEKTEVSSQKTLIGTTDFDAITIAGAGDLSLQIIKRSSPDFLNLWMELLAEAYAIESEDQAITSLLLATGGVGAAIALDPEDMSLGAAYVASFDAIRRPPDTIWLSTEAVGEFIDAKATTTNQPLYPGLAASATAAGGITGVISGLRPVHVPSLDAHGAYAIVGPSSGFAWAEDGTYTLQVDVPAKAGRDVALVGLLWPCPWYPAAFTTYNVAS